MHQLPIMKTIILVFMVQFSILSAASYIMKSDGTLTLQTTQSSTSPQSPTTPQTPNDENNQTINAVSVKTFGAIGDGITDDTLAIQNAINSESKLYFPEGRYRTTNSIYPKSNSVLISDNATIYYTRSYNVSVLEPAFFFDKVNNIKMIGHWIFEGDSLNSKFDKTTSSPDQTYTLGLKIKTDCSDIYIESLEGFNFTAGVMEIGADHAYNISSKNITVDKIKVYNCWNAPLAITSGTNIHFKNVETFGAISNSNYAQIGFDIEVNNIGDTLENIQIDKLVTHNNNVGFQILTMSQAQKGITINDLASFDNNENGVNLLNATDFNVKNVNIYNNKGAGLFIEGTFKNISLDRGNLFNNQNHGILAQMDASRGIAVFSENLNIDLNIYNNYGYGILLSGTEEYPVNKFTCTGKAYDDQSIKTQEIGIDVQKNVLDLNITAKVYGNKYFQILK